MKRFGFQFHDSNVVLVWVFLIQYFGERSLFTGILAAQDSAVYADVTIGGSLWDHIRQQDYDIVYGTSSSPVWNFTYPSTWEKNYPDCAGFLQSPIVVDMSMVQSALDGFLQLLFPNPLYIPRTPRKVTYDLVHATNEEKLYMLNVTSYDITLFSSVVPHYYRLSYVRVYGSMHRFIQQFEKIDVVNPPSGPSSSTVRQDIEIIFEFVPINPINRIVNTTSPNQGAVQNSAKVLPRLMISFPIKDAAVVSQANAGSSSTITMDSDLELFVSGVDDIPFVRRSTMDRIMGGDTFIMYPGSLPNPPCTESVVWMISPTPILASKKQMALLLASVKEGKPPTETSVAKQLKNAPSDVEALAQLVPFRRPEFGANGRSLTSRNFRSS